MLSTNKQHDDTHDNNMIPMLKNKSATSHGHNRHTAARKYMDEMKSQQPQRPLQEERSNGKKSEHMASLWKRCPNSSHGYDLNPLATPKGQSVDCDMCGAPAYFTCKSCRNANYCTEEHLNQDRKLMHPAVCHMLKLVKGPVEFSNYLSERMRLKAERMALRQKIIDTSFERARRSLRSGEPRNAMMQGAYGIRFARILYKQDDVHFIPFYLVFAEANAADGDLRTAAEYMKKTEYIMLINKDCPNKIKADLYKTSGIVNLYGNKIGEAIISFSDEIFYAIEAFHPEHKRTAEGYFNLGTVFLRLNKPSTAHSLFMHAVDIMCTTLFEDLQCMVDAEAHDLLGVAEPDSIKTNLTELEICEHKMELYFIYEQVTNMQTKSVRDVDVIKVCYVLALFHYVTGDHKPGVEFIDKANIIMPIVRDQDRQTATSEEKIASPTRFAVAASDMHDKLKYVKKHLQRQIARKAKDSM